ncbi:hypothetical protein [Halomarina litorea]|uniref:hypothetical protein n=1 Tax=Halomarina litorea TaxID=2961595 RepID=UPI0020C47B50|nr:hypothetical protein [Halomarina sp. BCD28]
MSAQQSDDCPVCGESYAERVVVERGLRWGDLFAGSPLDYFGRYRRRCTAGYDVERDRQVGEDERVAYFHAGEERPAVF